jgi:hypothetical protein
MYRRKNGVDLENNMIISHKHKFIFIKTFKTAGTSIEVFLSQFCDENDILTPINPHIEPHLARNYKGGFNPLDEFLYLRSRNIAIPPKTIRAIIKHALKMQKFYNHIPAELIKQRISMDVWNEYHKFCVVRNPWDLTISHYYRSSSTITFDDYIKKGIFRNNFYLYTNRSGDLLLDKVIKYESMMDEFSQLFRDLGIPFNGSLGVHAKSEHRKDKKPYQEFYSDEQKEIIGMAFEKEIKMHGYAF